MSFLPNYCTTNHVFKQTKPKAKSVLLTQFGMMVCYRNWWKAMLGEKYRGANKYLVSHQLCKFSHLKIWERPVISIIGTLQLDKMRKNKSRKSHCRIFNEFICKLWWKISIWSPTNKLSQTCNFFFKRLLCPPLVNCINGTCLNLLSV